ncbi:MAG: type II toxin-antitoxin system YafQ family toxin [Clostridium sp.]|nr:type II toxin-antitoxin system YafQ family toxin [Clostridium sp.]
MYSIEYTGQFKKSLKLCKKRGLPVELLHKVISLLMEAGKLPPEYKPHVLSGKYAGIWECHIRPDWLLLWKQDNDTFTLLMLATGTHSDLF